MAITTLSGVIAGMQSTKNYAKYATVTLTATRWFSHMFVNGSPADFATSWGGLSGTALTSATGQIPFTNPISGNTYLAEFRGEHNNMQCSPSATFADLLWINSGLVITSATAQTINSVAFPARDINGTINGEGVYVAVIVSSVTGAGTPSFTMSYTNSDGVAGRTGTGLVAGSATCHNGSMVIMSLQAGDKGVRSIQTFTLSATWTSGTIHLIAFRPIAMVSVSAKGSVSANGIAYSEDAISLGMPRLFDNTVPFIYGNLTGNSPPQYISAFINYTQG